jgi:adenosylmethionine-8-amino-7-oxononanoate aminotransferase
VELVCDPLTKEPFPVEDDAGQRLTDIAFELGLIIYPRRSINGMVGDHVMIAPPLIISASEVDEVLQRFEHALELLRTRLGEGHEKT